MRRLALSILLLFALLAPTGAGAGVAGLRHSAVRLPDCDDEAHSATFAGSLRAFGRATGLQMRFTLQTRSAGTPWERVEAPGFDEWLTAASGKRHYVYDKEVNNLAVGAAYRTIVRFRWRDAAGAVVARALRRSPACRQPDDRPNLTVTDIGVRPGSGPNVSTYVVHVLNDGDREASGFAASLRVSTDQLAPQSVTGPLVEGGEAEIEFEASHCGEGSPLTATVDTEGSVDESDETDNGLTVPCPAQARR